jgi:hypothetical protein
MKYNEELREQLKEINPELLVAEGFDDCIIGVTEDNMHVVYDATKMMQSVFKDSEAEGMTQDDAWDYLGFNVFCAYVGDTTPIYINKLKDLF